MDCTIKGTEKQEESFVFFCFTLLLAFGGTMKQKLRKFTALLLAIVFVFSPLMGVPFELPALAESIETPLLPLLPTETGTTGDCTWILDGTKLTVSGNGVINNKDLGLLQRFVIGWDVELK